MTAAPPAKWLAMRLAIWLAMWLGAVLGVALFTASANGQATGAVPTEAAPADAPPTQSSSTTTPPPAEHFFESSGLTFRYFEAGRGDLVILLHGLGANADLNWVRPGILPKLAQDFRVVALDCRGHGKSGKPHTASEYGQKMAHDVAALLDQLQAPRAHIVGYSMGGVIAAKFATMYPQRVITLTLGGTAGRRPPTPQEASDDEALASSLEQGRGFRPLLVRLQPPNERGLSDASIAMASAVLVSRNDPKALAALVRGLSELAVSDDEMKAIEAPMMAVVGTADPNLRNVEALAERRPDLRVVKIDRATHVGAPRGAPARPEFLAAVHDFITAHRPPDEARADPAVLYKKACAVCHDNADVRAPDRQVLKAFSPAAILAAMTTGTMAVQAKGLTAAEKRALAEYLGMATPRGAAAPATPSRTAPVCAEPPIGDPSTGPRWSGWSADPENSRFQKEPGLRAEDVPKLKLKWAFGFPGATSAYAQPAVVAGRIFVGSATGVVYALDAASGCAHWSYTAPAAVRTAISVGPVTDGRGTRQAAFFGDIRGGVHAIDAATGTPIWSTQADAHPAARITGAPLLHANRLYVPVSSSESVSAGRSSYTCCTFRGSVVALDTATGAVVWRAYTMPEPARATTQPASGGAPLLGPAGAAVWNTPTLDLARRTLYVGTGNAYSGPPTGTSDAILAIDMDSGRIRWSRQFTPDDVFIVNCLNGDNRNCPKTLGPDFDFGSSPILRRTEGGRTILIAGQKSGMAYGLDPDKEGAVLWQFRAGRGGTLGGIQWGMAADEEHVYIPVSDRREPEDAPRGLFAVRITDGEQRWYTQSPQGPCKEGRGCLGALSAAVTAIPGVVFAGAVDGQLRAYSTRDGRILWSFDTAREFETVNLVKANGGTIDAAGPVVVDGLLLVNSGYGMWRSQPGNVLLAFAVEP